MRSAETVLFNPEFTAVRAALWWLWRRRGGVDGGLASILTVRNGHRLLDLVESRAEAAESAVEEGQARCWWVAWGFRLSRPGRGLGVLCGESS